MADIKVSEMQSATSLNPDDLIMVVQSGSNKKATFDLFKEIPIDNLNSTSTTDALSANQGRILNEKIEALQEKDNEFIKTVSNSNGTAIKFADGTMICTKTITFSPVNITTADGSLYISSYLELGNFAESFIAKPIMNINKINNWAAFVFTTTDVTNSSAGRIVLAKGDTVANGTFSLDIIAIGRWK